MKKRIIGLVAFSLLASFGQVIVEARSGGFGSSFGGTALGSFTGTMAGSAIAGRGRDKEVRYVQAGAPAVGGSSVAYEALNLANKAYREAIEATSAAQSASNDVKRLADDTNAAFGRFDKRLANAESEADRNKRSIEELKQENGALNQKVGELEKTVKDLSDTVNKLQRVKAAG